MMGATPSFSFLPSFLPRRRRVLRRPRPAFLGWMDGVGEGGSSLGGSGEKIIEVARRRTPNGGKSR